MMNDAQTPRIAGLEQLLRSAANSRNAPVEAWNPPYCGDIGLAIAADGTWSYRGSRIDRRPLVLLFARVLRHDADGKFYLVTPAEKIDIAVADAPFLAEEMEVRGAGEDQQLIFRSNVDDVVTAGPDHALRFAVTPDGGVKPYVRVRGRLDALLSRSVTYDLLALAEARPGASGDDLGVWSAGSFFSLPPSS